MRGKGFTLVSLLRLWRRSCKGFTLIELLVTISILAILMSIALISYSSIQKGSRDAKRKSDISTIQSALEQYHTDQGFYPSQITPGNALTNQVGINPTPATLKIYSQKLPQETKSGQPQYVYNKKPDTCSNTVSNPTTYCTNYCLYATMEDPLNKSAAPPNCPVPTIEYQVQAP